ncbi:hypothetical protein ACFW35_01890 [Fictibacillus sp. NPDC058756]|uniref:hypothetical protein n=1 Tax=Fictibacillus sp. NPDC058756 TaxID=3346625 RepID=UPI0036AAFAA6
MKNYVLMGILCFIFILSGCGDPVQDELLNYVNEEMRALGDKEGEIVEKYADVTGLNYTDDATLYNALKEEIIPEYNVFIKDLEAVEIDSDELVSFLKTILKKLKKL